MTDEPEYWFPVKGYGWGWGVPPAWQGCAAIAAYVALIGVGFIVIVPSVRPGLFLVYLLLLTILLIAVCWIKGEPPRWRRGDIGREQD